MKTGPELRTHTDTIKQQGHRQQFWNKIILKGCCAKSSCVPADSYYPWEIWCIRWLCENGWRHIDCKIAASLQTLSPYAVNESYMSGAFFFPVRPVRLSDSFGFWIEGTQLSQSFHTICLQENRIFCRASLHHKYNLSWGRLIWKCSLPQEYIPRSVQNHYATPPARRHLLQSLFLSWGMCEPVPGSSKCVCVIFPVRLPHQPLSSHYSAHD